jgi:anti-sigma-K factor RskA
MNQPDHSRWSDDLAAYLLGALEPREADAFERHLRRCESCQAELRWLEPAVHSLPETVARQAPPRQLRDRLMSEVRAEAGGSGRSVPARGRPRTWLSRPAVGFAVLALLVAGVVGYAVGRGGSDRGGGDSDTIVRQAGDVTVAVVREGQSGTLRLAGLNQPPKDKVLEAWVERAGKVEGLPTLFLPDRHGQAETRIADLGGVEAVMVTEEPRGGSDRPTSAPIVSLGLPQ